MKVKLLSTRFVLTFSLLALVFASAVVLYAAWYLPHENTMLRRTRPITLSDGWQARDGDEIAPLSEPSRPAANNLHKPLVLTTTLPSSLPSNLSLCFQTKNESVRVYLGDECVYAYGETPQRVYGHGVGAIWNFAKLPGDAGGKTLTVELTPVDQRTGLEPYRFLLGNHDCLISELIMESMSSLIACTILALIGLSTMIMTCIEWARHEKRAGATFHFSVFVLLSTLWVAADRGITQFFIADKGVSYLLFGCSFYLLCSPFAMFMAETAPEHKRLFRAFSMANSAYAVLRIALYAAGVVDFETGLWILHLLMATLILGVNITLLAPVLRTKQFRGQALCWATSALSIVEGVTLLLFYAGDKLDLKRNGYSAGFDLGILAFVSIVAVGAYRRARYVRQQAFKAEFFEKRAYTDELTGLLNVKGFDDKCAALLREAPSDACYAVIDFDVNYFSQYNANNGLDAGDELLKWIGDTLRDLCREGELFARQEADHFVVLVKDTSMDAILARVRAADAMVREALSEKMLLVSYGVVEVQNRALSPATLRNHALVAKHTVKGNYEQNIALYDHRLHEAQLEEMELLSGFEAALQGNEYVIFLQPKIDAVNESLRGAEALVRRLMPDGSVTSAWTIIKAHESKGFVAKLDYYILEQVCKFHRRCLDEGRTCSPISNNFSRVHLFDLDFPARIAEVVDKYRLPYDLIEIELTETAFLVGKDTLQTMVRRLHERGFRVAIDDFGTGYSSLTMLKDVDVDIIKLDRAFLANCTQDPRAAAVIEHTLRLAQEMDIATVAEGVETIEELNFLRNLGCDMIQGYYYSRPLPEEASREKYL